MHHYFIIYKPYEVLCQFSKEGDKKTLKDFFDVPSDVYPVGRLDYDSEGLLLLTNDKKLNHRLLNPSFEHERTYWVQVDGNITDEAVDVLKKGVTITVDGKAHRTRPAKAKRIDVDQKVPPRNPPIRFRKNIPTSWIELTLTEGKNRQVRKMTAAVGFPTLRLIRYSMEGITIDGLLPGDMMEMKERELYKKLKMES
ncbi:pseudouridine synthase [Pinibacter soli]|uniref:Pseudouridine synthase n=1 Tax=Pinibacter soli TaxID=3044211 RepID=A0ABT6RCL3_9BACT|nr:pseudouridine synthase [Pinibacter soli]MDI3320303.1 pseudouridine synthase [Pinibacter soli]